MRLANNLKPSCGCLRAFTNEDHVDGGDARFSHNDITVLKCLSELNLFSRIILCRLSRSKFNANPISYHLGQAGFIALTTKLRSDGVSSPV